MDGQSTTDLPRFIDREVPACRGGEGKLIGTVASANWLAESPEIEEDSMIFVLGLVAPYGGEGRRARDIDGG
jgi:hypothetical protein